MPPASIGPFALLLALMLPACASLSRVPAADLSAASAGDTFTRQGDYLLSAGDQVSVRVFGQDALSGTYPVAAAGTIMFPLVGWVQASGLTAPQLTARLQKALGPFVKSPIVTVSVPNRDSFRVFFSGAMQKPGVVTLETRTTLLQGIALGGGLTNAASGRIVLVRHAADGTVRRYATTYTAALAGANGLDRFVLERGDLLHAE